MENLVFKEIKELGEFTQEEEKNLHAVMEEQKGWCSHDVDRILSVMAEDAIYHDITLPPAKGHEDIRKFAEGWIIAAPDFYVFVDTFIVKGGYVVAAGRISGTITGDYFGTAPPNKSFDCMFCQVALVENGKIKYIRDYWDSHTMMQQVGWARQDSGG